MPKKNRKKQYHSSKKETQSVQNTGRKVKLRSSQIQVLFIAFLSIVLYLNTLSFKYALDDGLLITDNALTKKGIKGIPQILTKDSFYGVFGENSKNLVEGGRYRPLSQVVFAIEYQLFGLSPFIGHLLNIILYSLLCVLLIKTLKKLFDESEDVHWYRSVAFIAALIFTVHPLHTEVVANIKGSDELFNLIFSLLTLYFSVKYVQDNKPINLIWVFCCFMLGLLSKESTVTFLAVIPLTIFVFTDAAIKKYLKLAIPLFAALAIFLIARFSVIGFGGGSKTADDLMNNPFFGTDMISRFATIMLTWGKYLLLLVFPQPLTHDYYPKQIPIIGISDLRAILPMIIYLALGVFAIIKIRSKNIIAFGILFFLITFSISSNIVFNIGTFMNERFMFVPSIGFAVIISYLLTRSSKFITKEKDFKLAVSVIIIVLCSLYSLKTFTRSFAWKDSYTLFTTDVSTSTNSAKCNVAAGEVLIKSIDDKTSEADKLIKLNAALSYLKMGVTIYPKFENGLVYLGFCQHLLKDYSSARESLEKVLQINTKNKDAVSYLNFDAHECYRLGNFKQAVLNFKTLIKYTESDEYKLNLVEVYEAMQRPDSSLILLNEIIKKDPQNDKAYNKAGEIYGRLYNDMERSLSYTLTAYKLNPKNPDNPKNLGLIYGIKGNYNESLKYFLEAYSLNPNDKDLLQKISLTYKNLGDKAKADEFMNKAVNIK
jgi:tetratricopeptide (TPR) repeat protein